MEAKRQAGLEISGLDVMAQGTRVLSRDAFRYLHTCSLCFEVVPLSGKRSGCSEKSVCYLRYISESRKERERHKCTIIKL